MIEAENQTVFRVAVHNRGQGFVPIHGQLTISAARGHALRLSDGYGRWLYPGEESELRFIAKNKLPDGRYQLNLEMRTSPDGEPKTQTLNIQLPVKETQSLASAR